MVGLLPVANGLNDRGLLKGVDQTAMTMKCFVIMPYAAEFNAVYNQVQQAAQDALPGEQIVCNHLRDVKAAGRITDDIVTSLREAAFCIADITGNNANVMWETGYAMALGKPTILIGQDVAKLPFDLKVHRILPYLHQDLNRLSKELTAAIQQTLSRYDIKADFPASEPIKGGLSTIAVTGSIDGDPVRVQRRIETILHPYLERGVMWYCSTIGAVDEAALVYLSAKKERVVAVAYNRFDFSDAQRRLIQDRKIQFIDASVEAIPKGLSGPSVRDIFFCMKADLIVLFWNGKSLGTQGLMRYFEQQGKNLLVGFI